MTFTSHKVTEKPLAEQVKEILTEKGLSKIFSENDCKYFSKQVKSAFNRAQAIADKFIEYYEGVPSDFSEYVF